MKSLHPAFAAISLAAGCAVAAAAPFPVFHHENVLGTSMELKFPNATPEAAREGESAALTEIDRLAHILSTYDPASEASRWMATHDRPVPVSDELYQVLGLFDTWRVRTGGALDAAAGVACALWKEAGKSQRVPSAGDIAGAVLAVRKSHWSLDGSGHTATHLSTAPLVLNSFAKSFIIERAATAARLAAHADAVVLNIGGDIVVQGAWTETVAIANPRDDAENSAPSALLRLQGMAVATSGGYRRGVEIAGRWYSHIVDPRTGYPAGHILGATVVAPEATDAGALATAFCVLKPEESLRLLGTIPGAECLLLTADGQRVTSRGWDRFEVPQPDLAANGFVPGLLAAATPLSPAATAPAAGSAWDPAMELVINLEVARPGDDRARRPYVAVWVEDKDKYPVRTLALWFKGERWLPDLRAWYHSDQLRSLAEGSDITTSVSSATRSPGKYTLKWDGKDNGGKPVKAGKYTVHIEAAREHGTYQLMKQEVDFSGPPSRFDLKGNTEIAGASLEYRRKPDGR